MRYWLLSSAIIFFAATIGLVSIAPTSTLAQGKKIPPKDKKDEKKPLDDDKDKKLPEFKEPTDVGGKSFDYWRNRITGKAATDPSERELAMKNVLLFGPKRAYEALDEIMAELNRQKRADVDLSVRVNGLKAMTAIFSNYKGNPEKKHIDDALALYQYYMRDSQFMIRALAVKGVICLGPVSRKAIPDVIKVATNPTSWELRKEALPILVILCAPDNEKSPANPVGLKVLHDRSDPAIETSHMVRMTALQGIAMLGKGLPNELVRALNDPHVAVKLQAIQAIATMSSTPRMDGQSRASAEKRLEEYLGRETDLSLNLWTHAAMMTLHKKVTPKEFTPIVKRVNHKEVPIRLLALQLIGMTGPDGKDLALKDVVETVHDPEIPVGVAAIQTLISMRAWETKPMLKKIVDDKKSNDVLHDAALTALNAMAQQEEFIEKMKKESKDKKTEKK